MFPTRRRDDGRPAGADDGPVYAAAIEPVPDLDDVLAANERFYSAFEARDLDAMSEVWDHTERASCTHPGWPTLRGWASIAASWFALFQGPSPLQFILTDLHASATGDVAWVTVDENVIGEDATGGTVAALNLFVRTDEGWRMVAHHGSSVVPRH
ncbi:MAG: hypothetical protein JWM05_3237 [Acidimicrobiales bacterium]|nr:hypothetical protein [Acidimicrobiales bacterium]